MNGTFIGHPRFRHQPQTCDPKFFLGPCLLVLRCFPKILTPTIHTILAVCSSAKLQQPGHETTLALPYRLYRRFRRGRVNYGVVQTRNPRQSTGFPKAKAFFLGIAIIRTVASWNVYWILGSPYLGKLKKNPYVTQYIVASIVFSMFFSI